MKTSLFTHYEKTILESIDLEGYNMNKTSLDNFDKIQAVYRLFKKEYVHKNNQHLKESVLFSEWLQGLPSSVLVPFYNSEILENGLLSGFNLSDETKEDEFLANYWINLSKAFFTLKENL